ncbi:MAG: carbohydrate-binding family 9-like protein [Acidobacteriota bacterium]
MTRGVTSLAVALLLLPQPAIPAQAPASDPRGYLCYRATSPLSVDGRLDDAAWREAPWTEDFVDIEGDRKPAPPLRTRAKMLWDDTYFYIGAELVEPHVWATMKAHDSVIFHENDFEFFIDPNGDNHEYYEFEINALGTGWDLLLTRPYKDGGKAVNNWEIAGLQSAVHVDGTLNVSADTDRGWSVELAVPWKALGELARVPSPPANGDQWRVNFSRVEWALETSSGAYRPVAGRREDNWVWSPQGVVDMHRPESWGYVQFSTARPATATRTVDPSLPARRWLHQVYYAQRAYRQAHGRWASTLEALEIPAVDGGVLAAPVIEVAGSLFQASIDLRLPGAAPVHWHIRQDALIWPE